MLFFRRMLTLLAVLTLFIGGCWSDEQVTLVHCAANGKTDCVERMLSDGASVNGHGKEGESPFYAAVRNRHYETATVFLEHGVSLSGVHMGHDYVEFAVKERDVAALRYLRTVGASVSRDSEAFETAQEIGDPEVLEVFGN